MREQLRKYRQVSQIKARIALSLDAPLTPRWGAAYGTDYAPGLTAKLSLLSARKNHGDGEEGSMREE